MAFLDLAGLSHFRTKLIAQVQSMIDSDSDRIVAIEQYVALYNGYMGTNLNYRDYINCSISELQQQLDGLSTGYGGATNGIAER